jgi:trk system potassium uptake protein TrkH
MNYYYQTYKRRFLNIREQYSIRIYPILKIIFLFNSFLSFGILIYEYGYSNFYETQNIFYIKIIINYFLFYEIINLLLYRSDDSLNIKQYVKTRFFELIVTLIVLILMLFENIIIKFTKIFLLSNSSSDYILLIYLSISQILILVNNFLHFSRNISNIKYKKINPSLIFLMSFVFIISLGVILLASPNAHNNPIDIIDIIFNVVSATCVTGLASIDIGKDLNLAGQIILLVLIQIGGLGLMTLTSFFSYYLSGQVSLTNQIVMRDLFSEISIDKVKNTLKNIALFTFIIESIGSILLYFTLPNELIPKNESKIFYAIFHSISAFCNAGFSLYTENLYNVSMISPISVYIIMLLIMFGGIGFPTINDLLNKFINKKHKLSLTTKIVLISNAIIWSTSFIVFLIFSEIYNMKLNLEEKILHGLFFAVTPRTAGFNTLYYNTFPMPLIFFTFLLMWIGASPVSTGGGIKTTTITIALNHIMNLLRGNRNVNMFNRRIDEETIIRAYSNVLLSLMTIFVGIFLLSIFEKHDFLKICFEVVSAYGTVGLSLGITSELTNISKVVLSLIMLTGRIGVLSMLLAIIPKAKELRYEYPKEYVIVG